MSCDTNRTDPTEQVQPDDAIDAETGVDISNDQDNSQSAHSVDIASTESHPDQPPSASGDDAVGNQAEAAPANAAVENDAVGNVVSEEVVSEEEVVGDEAIGNARASLQTTASVAANTAQCVAATAWNDEVDDLDDDIGNRIDGPAHHERTSFEEQAAASGHKRGKRPRNRGAKSSGSTAASGQGQHVASTGGKSRQPARERPAFRAGEEVFGKVIAVLDEAILVDLNGKAKAIFDRRELTGEPPAVDDQFIAQVHTDGSRGGHVVLTRNPDRQEQSKQVVADAMSSGATVEALVTGVIKGGVEVDADGLRGFCPASHVDLRLGVDLTYLIGQRLPFKVIKYAKNGKEVVLSRRDELLQRAEQARKQGLAKLQPGAVVDAVVRTVVDWGVFVSIPSADDVEGLVHISELSYERIGKPSDILKVGDPTKVKVLRIDDNGKLWLSRKAVQEDPWQTAVAHLTVGTKVTGEVVRIQPFGVFVQLVPGIDGLIRTADLGLDAGKDPSEVVTVGQQVQVVVVHVDARDRRIALHPALPEGEEPMAQKVALYRTVKVQVVEAQPAGLAVRIVGVTGAAARGFIPAGHTATARGTELRKEFAEGTQLDAKIIELDPKRGTCKLSIRAMKEDSEKAAYNEYRNKVAREAKFGTLGDLLAKHRGNS